MDTKIPKPSQLKKPMIGIPIPKLGFAEVPSGLNRVPLKMDLANIPESNVPTMTRKRAASPDVFKSNNFQNKAKLRRSRSACDIRTDFLRPKAHPMAKPPNLTSNNPGNASTSRGTGRAGMRRSRSACDLALKENVVRAIKRQGSNLSTLTSSKLTKPVARPTVTRPAIVAKSTFPKTNSTASSINSSTSKKPTVSSTSAGPAKIAPKKIPPYDYKARFLDLTERHNALKEKFATQKEQMGQLAELPDMYESAQQELVQIKAELAKLKADYEESVNENETNKIKISSLARSLSETERDLTLYKRKFEETDREARHLKTENVDLKSENEILKEANEKNLLELEKYREELFKANIERKDLHNMVMDLRGNIRVFCRVRPPLESELDRLECEWSFLDESSLELSSLEPGKNKVTRYDFSFDHVFHKRTSQEDIFDNVSPLIQSALDGYNVCIFAYGQTGSGKTYTMDGITDNLGVIPRTVDLIFNSIDDYKRLGWDYEIRVTFLEIYNEILYDLLDTSGTTKELEIRMASAKNKTEIYVSNIIEETVQSGDHLRKLMAVAKMNRATAATAGNERSSRSHAVTRIQLIGQHKEKGEISIGTINLVDLAGSESPKTSTRMDETKNINRSLSELSNVILALVQKNEHIPYRNSKLTHLLMPSLGGNSKTLMFVNVSPFQDCFTETVKSLRFAAQVNSCKMQKAKKVKMLNQSNTF